MIPLMHDFEGERVLVFGGGSVGARKARRFTREADVVVVSPRFDASEYGDSQLVRAAPTTDTVDDWLQWAEPALVVAATDERELNEAIHASAREREILCNRADQSGSRDVGSVVVPATVRDGPVVVSVSTDGTSPVVSRYLRQQLEETIDGAGEMAKLTADLRTELTGPARNKALREVVTSEDVWKALDTEGANSRQVATDVIADVTGDSA